MHLRAGIPLAEDVQALVQGEDFQDHLKFHDEFRARHRQALKRYYWSRNPLRLWSRRWEYPFAAQRILGFARENSHTSMKMLDAGSGVTYFPYFLTQRIERLSVRCVDNNASYRDVFAGINGRIPNSRVEFQQGSLQRLPVQSGEIDVLSCISVLEHTGDYAAVLSEFARVLRPGGLLVLTFDISLDGKFKLTEKEAGEVLEKVRRQFVPEDGRDLQSAMDILQQPKRILSTEFVRETEPDLLPWKRPLLVGLKDLIIGHGWTGGFRSKTVFCMSAIAAIAQLPRSMGLPQT